MRDHGGNLDEAKARFGAGDWIDLSTGINRRPWSIPEMDAGVWRNLPTRAAQAALLAQARQAWHVGPEAGGIALGGAQAAIQMVPCLRPTGRAAVLGLTYNEHAACLERVGWTVTLVSGSGQNMGVMRRVFCLRRSADHRELRPL